MIYNISTKNALKSLSRSIKNKLEKSIDKSYLTKSGRVLAEDIRRRTRLGQGVKKAGAKRRKLKPLAQITKIFRKEYRNKLSKFTSPNKSNLTFTGQLLDSLDVKITKKNTSTLYFKGIHIDIDGGRMSNDELAEKVTKQGRPFLGPTNREIERYKNSMRKQIIKGLK